MIIIYKPCNKTFLLLLNLAGYLQAGDEDFSDGEESAEQKLDWWQNAVIYQIHPRSFMDSDGDGVGDLRGIEEKSQYFSDLGVDCVCLSPIFKSPLDDYGYDVSNHREIDEAYGTIDDFVSLKKKLKSYGIRLIMDFVPNHSSDEHEWFKKSEQRIDPYTDYYVWRDAQIDQNGSRAPPNNWQSLLNNSAWTWNQKRGQYYLHQFDPKQPDFNYRKKELVEEIKGILKFWLDLGVDGYKLVAAPFLFEDSKFLDESKIREYLAQKENNTYDKIYHHYTSYLPDTYAVIYQLRDILDEYKIKDGETRVLITEANGFIFDIIKFCGNNTHSGAHVPFNLELIENLKSRAMAMELEYLVNNWMYYTPKGKPTNWAIGNIRVSRVATRFGGGGMVDAMNALNLLLPGIAFTYTGEEIGMTDGRRSPRDRAIHNVYRVRSETLSPYQWNASTSAGFSSNPDTWLPVNSDYATLNLDDQKKSNNSHYHVYKRLIELRKSLSKRQWTYGGSVQSGPLFMFSRSLTIIDWLPLELDKYVVVINVGTQVKNVNVSDLETDTDNNDNNWFVHTCSVNMQYNIGDRLSTNFTMAPKSALVLCNSCLDTNDFVNKYIIDNLIYMSSSPSPFYPSPISLVALAGCILANKNGLFGF